MSDEPNQQISPFAGLPNEQQLEREIRAIAERTVLMRSEGFVTHLIVNRANPAMRCR